MQSPKQVTLSVVVLALLGASTSLFAQRPLCNQVSPADRERARSAGLCRDPAPIIDIRPEARPSDVPLPPSVPSTAASLEVPNVVGQSFDEARGRLSRFTLQRSYRAAAEAGGTVLEQQPAEGTLVKRGSVVRLQVSAGQEGPEVIDVPSVVGMPFDQAKSRLTRFSVERAERPRTER